MASAVNDARPASRIRASTLNEPSMSGFRRMASAVNGTSMAPKIHASTVNDGSCVRLMMALAVNEPSTGAHSERVWLKVTNVSPDTPFDVAPYDSVEVYDADMGPLVESSRPTRMRRRLPLATTTSSPAIRNET